MTKAEVANEKRGGVIVSMGDESRQILLERIKNLPDIKITDPKDVKISASNATSCYNNCNNEEGMTSYKTEIRKDMLLRKWEKLRKML